ncbi:hypothetical protein Q2T76_06420 [Lactobacillus sp. YT155]|uniref:hypothetical protein n=1 Tax=Lactobacillus sp. YT155 TaxID=3060955 RepID=UPI00265E197B|nr:hypothetical protein [Lactobacillus sp. YT155]MDO1605691.1 hypothetical protein [Lactobacillus sp. YT155]
MKLVANVKDRLTNSLKALMIFYGLYAVLTIAMPFIASVLIAHESAEMTVMDVIFPSFIYSVTIGLIIVTQRFNNSIQFGSSRKTIFVSYLINSTVVSAVLVLMNLIFSAIISHLSWIQVHASTIHTMYKVSDFSAGVLAFNFVIFLLATSIGTFSGLLFKRLKKITLMIIGAACVFLPMLLGYIFNILPKSSQLAVFDFLGTILGVPGPNIWAPITTIFVLAIILYLGSWLVIRRQPVK